jgi:hypothetical protein
VKQPQPFPGAMQRLFALLRRTRSRFFLVPQATGTPGSAAHRHSASKTRVNTLIANSYALRCVRETELRFAGAMLRLQPIALRQWTKAQRRRALQRMAARAWTLPEDYPFDRDEAKAR